MTNYLSEDKLPISRHRGIFRFDFVRIKMLCLLCVLSFCLGHSSDASESSKEDSYNTRYSEMIDDVARSAWARKQSRPPGWLIKIEDEMTDRHYEKAVRLINEALRTRAAYRPQLMTKRAYCYQYMKQPEKALADYKLLIADYPKDGMLLCHRAAYLEGLGRHEEAAHDYATAAGLTAHSRIEIGWTRPDYIYRDCASCYAKAKLWKRAIYYYSKAIAADSEDEEARRYRGDCYAASSDWKSAISDYTQSISLESDGESAGSTYFARAQAYEKIGEIERAKQDKLKAAQLGYTPRTR